MTDFQTKGYVLVKGFLDPDSVSVVSRYLENALKRYPENNQGGGQGDSSKYSILRANGNIRASTMKMQRTGPGGGYHVWHGEQGPGRDANRVVVYMLYLNSLDGEGGETEFLYQKMRIKPEENLMLVWPAAYTHAHRGNPVLGETHKYIVTGWFYYD